MSQTLNTPAVPPAEEISEAAKQLIEKARVEEKTKLHDQIARLESLLQEAQSKLSASDPRISELESKLTEATEQLSILRSAKTSEGALDVKAIIEQTRELTNKEAFSKIAALEQQLKTIESERNQERLNSLKQQLISAANGRIIPALVVGNTEAEIRASAEAARTTYEDIFKAGGTSNQAAATNLPPAVAPRVDSGAGISQQKDALDGFTRGANRTPAERQALINSLQKKLG